MKRLFIVLSVAAAVAVISCKDREEILITNEKCTDEAFVIETFTNNLPLGVDSIQNIVSEHPVVIQANNYATCNEWPYSYEYDKINNYCIYHYNNYHSALLMSSESEDFCFVYMYDRSTSNFIEYYIYDFSMIKNIKSPMIKKIYNPYDVRIVDFASKGDWLSCWKKSLKKLYDDYDEDPIGSLSCAATTLLCAVGGAIACAIDKDAMEEDAE